MMSDTSHLSIAVGSRLRNVFNRDLYATVEDHSPARDGQPERWRLSVDAEGPAHEVGWSMDGLIGCWEHVG